MQKISLSCIISYIVTIKSRGVSHIKGLFSIGELSKLQSISRQTLIFYDRIGLFCPAYVDPDNGYRYYSAKQLDELDTILIMKRIGFSLEEIKAHMQHYTVDNSLTALQKQLTVIHRQLQELQMIKSRVEHRCLQLEHAAAIRDSGGGVTEERLERQAILLLPVEAPYSQEQVSLATKECFVRSFREQLPIFFQSGAVVPYERVRQGRCTEASHVFLPIELGTQAAGVAQLPAGRCVCTYHIGDYPSIGSAYQRLLNYCGERGLRIVSDAYEFAINDYLSTGDESEYVTKVLFYVAG